MVDYTVVMGPLSQALGLSVVVERLIEFGKNIVEPAIRGSDARARPDPGDAAQAIKQVEDLAAHDAQSKQIEDAAEGDLNARVAASAELQDNRAQLLATNDPTARHKLLERNAELRAQLTPHEQQGEIDERVPPRVIVVEDANDPDQGVVLRAFVLQILGLAVGILLASYADLRLFSAFLSEHVFPVGGEWMDHLLTGLFIGGGSAPVHTLIRFISDRKTTVEAADIATQEDSEQKRPLVPPVTSASVASTSDIAAGAYVDIPYEGGVDVVTLESVHRRDKDPDLVVYHHTAMNSESTFDDVVRVIKGRSEGNGSGPKWLTGYNCVILKDGSIHAFCRWDRYGNHAVGYNRRSLGISFNGNFETNPHVPYSNADGRYGAIRPTDPQLRAGARVVALWTFLYPNITLDFDQHIIPHRQISSKACPGSNFPYDEFEKLVRFYCASWQNDPDAKARINAFKLKPYLFVKGP